MKKSDMLKKNKQFRYVVSRGKAQKASSMVLVCAKNRTGVKVGLSVSAKLGNAVVRNRTKRIMRAALTPLMPRLKRNTAYLFIAKAPLVGKKTQFAREEMLSLLQRAGVMNSEYIPEGGTANDEKSV